MSAGDQPKSVIAIDVRRRGNARLLERVIGREHNLLPDTSGLALDAAELTIVDPATLRQREREIQQTREQASPVILPVLLIAETRDLRNGLVERHLGRAVDDVVRIPTTSAELRARVDNLLRMRRLSREQYARHQLTEQALRGTARALRALNAGNEMLVRVQRENELLAAICRIIIEEGQYPFAWIGFRPGADAEDETAAPDAGLIEVCSSAGARSRIGGAIDDLGPARRALASGEPQTVPDLRADPGETPCGAAHRGDLASALFLPILPHMGPAGVLAIYSQSPNGFSQDERDLLERLAGNLMVGVGTIRADRDRERQRKAIRELAFSDPLTGLSNRAHLVERLKELLGDASRERPVAVLFIDLDQFKMVNDALGHMAGDEVLRQVGHRLANTVRAGDLVARQGGDEFIVVMSDAPRSGDGDSDPEVFTQAARDLAAHVARALREPLIVQGYERRIGVSVGISLYPEHGDDPEVLIDKADTAMYGAKLGRSDRGAVYTPAMSQERRNRLSLEARLHRAVERGELELCYQPIVELRSDRIAGAEALLRWPQEDGGFIAPADFIPVAEDTGLIGAIGEWVLATAARQIARWHAQSLAIPVAVNISPRQLHAPGDQRRFADVVAAYVDPAWLELEVTESVIMSNPEATEQMLRAFTDQGFRLAVDDFGTGYSSLTRLRYLPIRTLKIDKTFVADLGQSRSGVGIVRTIIELAHSLSMMPVAEGVETERQRDLLLAGGCERGQGHLFSPPVPADELARLVRRQRQTPPHELSWQPEGAR